jgi:uncharacterized protein (TIGR00299 family) protein
VIAYLDCSTGVSGDKFLGSLLDIGTADGRFTEEDLQRLLSQLAPEAQVRVGRVRSRGLAAVGIVVEAVSDSPSRTWSSIRGLLESADLSGQVRTTSVAVFERLAEAEAHVHASTPDEVHFHEVGAIDSLLDVVGVCAGLEALGVDRLVASPVATGWGTVDTSHGTLGVPAPATARLLLGTPTVSGPSCPKGSAPGELTTPTGAALLAGLCAEFGPCPPMVPEAVGCGAGTRDIGSPNVCRLTLGRADPKRPVLDRAPVTLLETNLDHVAPEQAAFAAEQVLAEGALDVWLTPIVMKKGRAAVLLSVLTRPDVSERTAERIVALTGTLGLRRTDIERFEAERESREVETPWGAARVKVGAPGTAHRVRPEHDDIARISRQHSLPYGAVRDEIARLAEEELRGEDSEH